MAEEMTGNCRSQRGADQHEKINPKLFGGINTTKILAMPGSTPPYSTEVPILLRNSDPSAEIYLPNLFQ